MPDCLYGYGKTLEVDLATRKICVTPTDPNLALEFVGGTGFGSRVLYDEASPGVDPLSPLNPIIIAAGPLTGTKAPSSGRIDFTTKSPLTGIIGSSNTGGMWGAMLKRAGYDLVIIRQASEQPVYLCINDAAVEIRDAGHLWGKDAWETTDLLEKELQSAPPKFAVMTIGPAGENLVRYACPINEYYHAPGRTGVGAVMGSKKLKAIVTRGSGRMPIAHPARFEAAAREARKRIVTHPKAAEWSKYASFAAVAHFPSKGCLPGKNFQSGTLPDFAATRGKAALSQYIRRPRGQLLPLSRALFQYG